MRVRERLSVKVRIRVGLGAGSVSGFGLESGLGLAPPVGSCRVGTRFTLDLGLTLPIGYSHG